MEKQKIIYPERVFSFLIIPINLSKYRANMGMIHIIGQRTERILSIKCHPFNKLILCNAAFKLRNRTSQLQRQDVFKTMLRITYFFSASSNDMPLSLRPAFAILLTALDCFSPSQSASSFEKIALPFSSQATITA